jgi:cobalt-zinc-cadmium efflux system outer membrane protein
MDRTRRWRILLVGKLDLMNFLFGPRRSHATTGALQLLCSLLPGFVLSLRGGPVEVRDALSQPVEVSLAQAQQMALERNWDLLASAAGVDLAMAQRVVAKEFPNPTLSVSTAKINVDNHSAGTSEGNGVWDRSYDTIVAVNQLFEIGGKRKNRKASTTAGYEAARAQFLDAKRTLDLAVSKAYATAAQADENSRVLSQSAASLRKEAGLAEVRLNAGEISTADKSQIDITAARFELDAGAAESAAAQARVALEVLLGARRAEGKLVLTEKLEALCSNAPPMEASHFVGRRPDVVAAEATLRKAEADLRLQKANRIPDPTVLAQYEHEPPDQPNTIGVGVSLPIPLWNRNQGNILAAEATRQQAKLALEKLDAQAAAEVATARLAYEDAARRWKEYREVIAPKSEHIRETVAFAYEKGGSSLLDLLVAERNDNDVRLAAAQAASDLAVASAALKAATTSVRESKH